MAHKLIEIRVNPLTNMEHREFICDTDADFADLPNGNPGDTAVSAATGNVYVVNASGEWVEFGGESQEPSENISVCNVTIQDTDWNGPLTINYKTYENGSAVDSTETLPAGETITIAVVQGTEIAINTTNSCWLYETDNSNSRTEYAENIRQDNGTTYLLIPSMDMDFEIKIFS